MTRTWLALTMSVLALGLVAGCGGDDDEEDGGGGGAATTEQPVATETVPEETDTETQAAGGEELVVTADEQEIAWEPNELTAQAGEVTLTLENPSQIPHNITLEEPEAATETVTNDTTSVTTQLEPGEYTYFCSVANHRQLGMEGTLTVE